MSDSEGPQRTPERLDQLLFGALAGLSVASVLQMIDKQPTFDNFLGASLLCFSVALPVVVSSFLLEILGPGEKKGTLRRLFDLAGVLLALVGFVLMFFHLQFLAGSIFLASVCLCVVVVVIRFADGRNPMALALPRRSDTIHSDDPSSPAHPACCPT